MMGFDGGTAYAESDADDEYERSMRGHSPVNDSEHSPIDSELSTSAEHTPTTYGHRSSADRLPETIVTEWTADECADFISSISLQQYADRFIGVFSYRKAGVLSAADPSIANQSFLQRTRSWERPWWRCTMTT